MMQLRRASNHIHEISDHEISDHEISDHEIEHDLLLSYTIVRV